MKRFILYYCKSGVALSDFEAEEYFKKHLLEFLKDFRGEDDIILKISTVNIIYAARCLKREWKFPADLVIREDGEEGLLIDSYVGDDGKHMSCGLGLPFEDIIEKFLWRLL